jgi:hypothetical protein
MEFTYDEGKFTEAVLYVATRLEADAAGGAVELNKALFHAEFSHMRAHRRSITGAEYQRLEWGPAPRRLRPVRTILISKGDAELRKEDFLGKTLERLVPLRAPDESVFTDSEKQSLDQAIELVVGRTSSDVSDASHDEPGWRMVEEQEAIPYEAAFLRWPVVTETVRRRVTELAPERPLL